MSRNTEWLKKEIGKKLLSVGFNKVELDMNIVELEYLIDQLEEPEKLSEEWIDEHSKSYTMENSVEISDLKSLLLPQPKKPVIPKFVEDFYENHKSDWAKTLTVVNYNMCEYDGIGELNEFENWYVNTEKALLILADMRNGYEVEEEKLYYLRLRDKDLPFYKAYDMKRWKYKLVYSAHHLRNENFLTVTFSESEIENMDIRSFELEEVTE